MLNQTTKQQLLIGICAITLFGAATAVATSHTPSDQLLPTQILVTEPLKLPANAPIASFEAPITRHERVQRGDTLSAILGRMGLTDVAFSRFVKQDPDARAILNLKPGRIVRVAADSVGKIQRFDVIIEKSDLTVQRLSVVATPNSDSAAEQYQTSEQDVLMERSLETKYTEIRSSLFAATDDAGIPESVAVQVADIFGAEVDFNKELRKGDTLRVTYESLRIADSLDAPAPGRIMAVEFVNRGNAYSAIWFEREPEHGEYFTAAGQSLKKAFLRSPLEFSRITSGFTLSRLHPISNRWGAHKGVDMAAPTGTKIRSSGDGVIDFVGQQNGYGNVIVIKHGKKYQTLYAHLNDFADGLTVGKKIHQGDVIGFVGSTGWATGPHLHYEFKVDGEHVDPMSAAMPLSEPLGQVEVKRFQQASNAYQSKLHSATTIRMAKFE